MASKDGLGRVPGHDGPQLARDYLREQRPAPPVDRPEQPSTGDRIQDAETKMLIQSALSELPARDRDLIRRRYYLGRSYREMGQALGMTTNHVGIALSRAEKRLRRILEKLSTFL